jgi:anthranilate phosphoribosyltransferase
VRAELAICGFAFVAIEPEIPILDHLYGGRFYAPNPFSFGLAPLASPVRGDITIFGLSHPRVQVAAEVLTRFGLADVDVLTTRLPGGFYLDEIGCAGEVRWCRVRDGQPGPVESQKARGLTKETFPPGSLSPRSPQEAIERTGDLLAGDGLDSHRALVSVNAAHLLVRSGITDSMDEGVALADDILRSGAALANVSGTRSARRSAS